MKRRFKSMITVFLCLMFLVFFLVIAATIDFTRIFMARAQIDRALNSAMLSVLAGYNERLKSDYGLLYINKSTDELEYNIKRLLSINLNPPSNVDGFNLYGYLPKNVSANLDNKLTLSNEDLLKTQIMEYSKYLAPLDIGVENYYGRLISGDNVDHFEELSDAFKQSFVVFQFYKEQAALDYELNGLISANFDINQKVYGDSDIAYVNRPFYDEDWLCTSPSSLKVFLEGRIAAGESVSDTEDILNEYIDRLGDTKENIEDCIDVIDSITVPLIQDLKDSISEFHVFFDDFVNDNDALFISGSLDETLEKLDFYQSVLPPVNDDIINLRLSDLQDFLINQQDVIDELSLSLNLIITYLNNGDENSALNEAELYDEKFDYDDFTVIDPVKYQHAPDIIHRIKPLDDISAYITDFPVDDIEDESFQYFMYMQFLSMTSGGDVVANFINDSLLGFSSPGNILKNIKSQASYIEIFDDIFAYNPGFDWVNNFHEATPPINDSLKIMRDICDAIEDSGEYRTVAHIVSVANFASTISLLTNDLIDNTSVYTDNDDFLERFLVDYYAMKNFTSYTTSPAVTQHESRVKKNFSGNSVSDIPDRLNYELEYILYGATDENESAKYAGLMLYGARVAQNYSFMHTNPEARKAVNTVAGVICRIAPDLEPRFTEVKEATALFWAACESMVELEVLKAGGAVYTLKTAGNTPFYYMRLADFMNMGLNGIKTNAIGNTASIVASPAERSGDRLAPAPTPAATHTPTPVSPFPIIPPPMPTPDAMPVYERMIDSEFNYDGHLMLLLPAVTNETKIRRIQEIIVFNRTGGLNDFDYLDSAYAAIEVQAEVEIKMMFLDWQMFRETDIGEPFRGGYTYEVKWFQKY